MIAEIAVKIQCELGEGPVWSQQHQTICWVDILKGEIHQYDTLRAHLHTLSLHTLIGAIAICKSGRFIAAMQEGLVFVNRLDGKVEIIIHPELSLSKNRFNDGKCDPAGRFWIGTMAIDESSAAGSLYTLDQNFHVERKIANTTISNGMAWSPDEQKFYHIDTPTMKVMAYTYNKKQNQISRPSVVITIGKEDGYPDGMTIDNEGMLWIAHWNGWQVTRWNPETGRKLLDVKLPVANVSSVVFGGTDLQDLYITTARKGLSPQQLEDQPLAGSLFVVKNSGFRGLKAFDFNDQKSN